MTRAEQEAAAIMAEQQAARERAPRAHALADDVQDFLFYGDISGLESADVLYLERLLIGLGQIDGRRWADMKPEEEKSLRAEFEALKEQARQHGAVIGGK